MLVILIATIGPCYNKYILDIGFMLLHAIFIILSYNLISITLSFHQRYNNWKWIFSIIHRLYTDSECLRVPRLIV